MPVPIYPTRGTKPADWWYRILLIVGTEAGYYSAYPKGRTVTVTQTKNENGNTWGKTSDGWFAIEYQGEKYAKRA